MTRRTVTIDEAARLTGHSKTAIRRRIDRGTLPAELVDGLRRVALTDLARAGLLDKIPPAPAPDTGDVDGALAQLEEQADELRAQIAAVRAELAVERRARDDG